jgi:biotin transport system substrate-specific component
MSSPASPSVRRGVVLADLLPGALARDVALAGGFALAIGLSARLALPIPGTPVPVTAQTLVVLLGAAVLGARRAGLGAVAYLALGLAGTPWFTATGGATLGYIVGFIAAAAVVGRLAATTGTRSVLGTAGLMALGNLVIYAFGVSFLALYLGIGAVEALTLGAVPFLIGDAVKVAIAAALLPASWRMVGHRG